MNVYALIGGEWLIVAACRGPHEARQRMTELSDANPDRRYVVADRRP